MNRRWRRIGIWLLVIVALPLAAHVAVVHLTAMPPPPIEAIETDATVAGDDPGRRVIGAHPNRSWARKRGAINEVRLVGDAVAVGHANVKLLYDQQLAIEGELHAQFAEYVPLSPARTLIVDMARVRFRNLDKVMAKPYLAEIAAQARAFSPDPFADALGMESYQRFVFLHSLYDIMLSFEQSPLIGCTSLVVTSPEGHTLVGRNFDFEGPQALDDHKAVFLMLEDGHTPYASVAVAGLCRHDDGHEHERRGGRHPWCPRRRGTEQR